MAFYVMPWRIYFSMFRRSVLVNCLNLRRFMVFSSVR